MVGRFPISGKLYTLPPTPTTKRRGAPRKKGDLIGSPKTLVQTCQGWAPHPSEAGAEIQAWCGLWHSVLPGRLVRVVVLRRDRKPTTTRPGQRKPPPAIEAFFTTDLTLSAQDILNEYDDRWAVEMEIRDANAFDGLGQVQCRKRQRILGANTFRLVMAAARTLWFLDQVERGTTFNLCRYRPWYRQKVAPSQLDVVWACREVLYDAGIVPIPRFTPDLAENDEAPGYTLPLQRRERNDDSEALPWGNLQKQLSPIHGRYTPSPKNWACGSSSQRRRRRLRLSRGMVPRRPLSGLVLRGLPDLDKVCYDRRIFIGVCLLDILLKPCLRGPGTI